MRLTYTLTQEDFKAAQDLYMRRSFGRWMVWVLTSRAVPGLALVCAGGAAVFFWLDRRGPFIACLAAFAVLVVFMIVIPAARSADVRKRYRTLFPSPDTDRSATIEIGDEKIVWIVPGAREQKIVWTEIEQIVEDAKISLICIAGGGYFPFPGYGLMREEREDLGAMIERHLGKR